MPKAEVASVLGRGTSAATASTHLVQATDQLVIIAGNGVYPQLVAEAARTAGLKKVVAIAFLGETDPKLENIVEKISWLRVGQLNRMLSILREWKITHAIMAGQIAPRNLFDLRPDWHALLLLAKLKRRNAESIFSAIALELDKIGVTLLPATAFMEQFLATAGLIAGKKLSRRQEQDIAFGWKIARQIAALDIGQTVIVKNGTVLAIEAFEGTNQAIQRGGALAGGKAIVIKAAKPNQDMRFDVPVIGVETIEIAAESKISVIAVEAHRTLLLERDAVTERAKEAELTLFGYSGSDR